MYYLEDSDGLFYSEGRGPVDDLDHATTFETREIAQDLADYFDGAFTVGQEID